MSLPSQSSRGGQSRRSGSYSRRNRRSRLPAAIVMLALLGGGAWLVYAVVLDDRGGPTEAHASEQQAARVDLGPEPTLAPAGVPPRRIAPAETSESAAGTSANQPITIRQANRTPEPQSDGGSGGVGFASGDDMSPAETAAPNAQTAPGTQPRPNTAVPSASPPPATPGTGRLSEPAFANLLAQADEAIKAGASLNARTILNRPLVGGRLSAAQARQARAALAAINADLFFSPRITPGDPFAERYTVEPGDSLATITRRQGLGVDWRLIQRINRITDPRRVRVGQTLKLVRGPFHCVVSKSGFRADIFAGPPDFPEEWVFVRSVPVGLGEDNGTPLGDFVVRRSSKLVNPYWVNPRTGERFDADDPKNPIGERWIGIEGVGEYAVHTGYGLHGTIEPESIGSEASMGCVRMGEDDIELVYELLEEEISRVVIVP